MAPSTTAAATQPSYRKPLGHAGLRCSTDSAVDQVALAPHCFQHDSSSFCKSTWRLQRCWTIPWQPGCSSWPSPTAPPAPAPPVTHPPLPGHHTAAQVPCKPHRAPLCSLRSHPCHSRTSHPMPKSSCNHSTEDRDAAEMPWTAEQCPKPTLFS